MITFAAMYTLFGVLISSCCVSGILCGWHTSESKAATGEERWMDMRDMQVTSGLQQGAALASKYQGLY